MASAGCTKQEPPQTNSMSQNTDSIDSERDPVIDFEANYPDYTGQIAHRERLAETDSETVPSETVLPEEIASEFQYDLFTHQADALDALADGEHVHVATSTSSGKTMVYALHIARKIRENNSSTALLIYPTKALSRDQQYALSEVYAELGMDITVSVYDGDTDADRRKHIRNSSDVIITNFSGISTYMNQHQIWDGFYEAVDVVAIDESHSYTGIQGMHVAWILRRLRRILRYYGADPQFVLTSATIGNPKAHSKKLTGVDVVVSENDGSPDGAQDIVFWEPPAKMAEFDGDTQKLSQRPADKEASDILAHLTDEDLQSLMFTRSRRSTAVNAKRAMDALTELNPVDGSDATIQAYNAGQGKDTRRSTEQQLKSGNIDGVVTTNALELGIDIGSVDTAILSGYPGTRQSFWQQIGRAGRGTTESLGLFVASYDSVDQYILNNPDYLLRDDNIEDAVIDLQNNFVFSQHLLCASQELPLTRDDVNWTGQTRLQQGVQMWKEAGKMVGTLDGGVQYNGSPRPQQTISMYAAGDDNYEIKCPAETESVDMEPITKERAYRGFHEGAVILHDDQQYKVTELHDDRIHPSIELQPTTADYYTQSMSTTQISDLTVTESQSVADGVTLHTGKGTVSVEYTGYQKRDISTNEITGGPFGIDLPPVEMQTQLMWASIHPLIIDELKELYPGTRKMSSNESVLGGLHAIEHGLISLASLELRMDKQDLAGLSTLSHPEVDNRATIFVYDNVNGGVGFSRSIYEKFDSIIERTETLITDCGCRGTDGCPACIVEDSCDSRNEPLHTGAAVSTLDHILTTRAHE